MKITLYGIIIAFSLIIGVAFVNDLYVKDYLILLAIFLISIYAQRIWCKDCLTSYSLASHLAIIPILVAIFFNCSNIHIIIFAFSIICAIGRIGCFFAGCCTGKVTKSSNHAIKYTEDFIINKQTNKKNVYVFPTIFIEIISQFIIAYLVYYHKFGVILYGILNAILLIFTSYWRHKKRMNNNIYLPVISLLIFSYIVYKKKCYNSLTHIKFILKPISIIVGIILGLIVSNDIQI
jgi:prolipoprotein diacylglyceryltransferase